MKKKLLFSSGRILLSAHFRQLLFLLMFAAFSQTGFGQVNTYTFTQTSGAYTALTTGRNIVFTATASATADPGLGDDRNFTLPNNTIPFTFSFNGVGYTGVNINTNGYVTFGTTLPATTDRSGISDATLWDGSIAALGKDLCANNNSGTLGEISYQTLGSSPNRKFVIQYAKYRNYSTSTTVTENFNFQIVLNETSNKIDIIYGACVANGTSTGASVGLRGPDNTFSPNVNNRRCPNPQVWSTSVAGTGSGQTMRHTTAVSPASGQQYTFTPAACGGTPQALTISALTSTSTTVSWTAPSPAPANGYEYAVTTSATPPASGTATSALSANVSLASGTDYYLHVRAVCTTGSVFSGWATTSFYAPCASTTVLPSTENFDGSVSCWTVSANSGNNWGLYTSISGEVPSSHSGANFAGLAWASGVNSDALLISPPYDLSANGNTQMRARVWVYRATTGVAADRITLLVNTSPTNTGATQILDLPRLITQAPTVSSAGWYEYIANIPLSYNSGTFYVIARGIEGGTGSNYSLGLDDFGLEFNPPTVTSFTGSPMCASGTDAQRTITITGTNFVGVTSVKVNGIAVQSFTVNSATQISAVVSASSTSGSVSVTGPGGSASGAGTLTIYQNYNFYADNDNDGFGAGAPVSLCSINATTAPAGYRTNNTDCNDNQLQYLDADGDGFGSTTLVACGVTNNSDCNDNQLQYADNDADGFGSTILVACGVTNNTDCNDNQLQYLDADGDGFGSTTLVACGVTNNVDCNDNQLQYADNDADGFGSTILVACGVTNSSDCNDNQLQYLDADSDGFGSATLVACGVTNNSDCNDNQLQYADNDADGFGSTILVACGVTNNTDCNDNQLQYLDADGDGFGSTTLVACGVTNNVDCNDNQLQYADNDADGFGSTILVACGVTNSSDCNDNQLQYLDADGDGFGSTTLVACGVANNTDCNDNNNAINAAFSFYADADGDSYGAGDLISGVCAVDGSTPPAGYSTNDMDCNDSNAALYQTALLYIDNDNDGYTTGATASVCYGAAIPSGYAAANIGIDCNDNVAAINPGHVEVLYNGVDDNCDGQLDEGFQITTTVQPSQCGTTLNQMNSLISAVSTPGATGYRFEVTNTTTNAVQILVRGVQYFSLNMLSSYDYATTYSIRVELQRNGIWLGYYGAPCLVSSPAVLAPGGAAQVSPSQCGITLPSISTLISTTSLAGVSSYRFRVTNVTDATAPNQVQIIDRPLQWFNMTMLATYNYGTTYLIEVAVKTNGVYSNFGSPCAITTPAVPSITNCGATITTPATFVYTTSLAKVTSYRFELTNLVTNQVITIDRAVHYFTFNNIPGFAPSTAYGVRVAVMSSGVYSIFSDACEITSPGFARPEGPKAGTIAAEFTAVAYPNPFAESFAVNVKTSMESPINVKVYDMTGRLLESREVLVSEVETMTVGERYPSGVYNVIVSQGDQARTLRVVKR